MDFTEVFQLKGLMSKNKGHTNFYECCDLTKKVYLMAGWEVAKGPHWALKMAKNSAKISGA